MKKKRPFGCLYIIIVLIFLGLFWYWQNYGLQTTRIALYYDVLPKGFDGYKIAHISDMHGIEFGRKNSALARRIRDFDPDIVVCTGDMISSHARDGQAFLDFLEEMGDQYPIYMCLGNHEQIAEWKEFESEFDYGYESFISQVKEAGVHILDNRTEILEKNGDKIRISGLALNFTTIPADEPYADDGLLLRPNISKKYSGSASAASTSLLAHNPSYFRIRGVGRGPCTRGAYSRRGYPDSVQRRSSVP